MGLWDEDNRKRSLGIRDKQILLERAGHKCENCGEHLEFSTMQAGHKKAHAKGGNATLKNSVALCFRCNKLQGTDSWEVFQKKQGKTVPVDSLKSILRGLSLQQLKFLAAKHGIKLKGTLVEGGLFSSDYRKAPSKDRYVKELAKVSSADQIQAELRNMPARW